MKDYQRISGVYGYNGAKIKISALVSLGFNFNPVDIITRIESKDARICKDRPKVRAVCSRNLFIKRYNLPGFWTQFRYRFRIPRPWKALNGAQMVAATGVQTPKVLAVFREEAKGKIRDYLVTEALSGNIVCGVMFADRMKEIIPAAMGILAKLHHAGIEHGDTSLRNWYQIDKEWGVLDLDGCTCSNSPLNSTSRIRDVAGFAGSYAMLKGESAVAEFVDMIVEEYQQLSGIKLNIPLYRKRIDFLVQRHHRRYGNGNL